MENELERKNQEKRKLRKEIRLISIQLKSSLRVLIYSALLRKISDIIRSKQKAVTMRHEKKLINLRKWQHTYRVNTNTQFLKKVVHNFSSYNLSGNEIKALPFELDQYIPPNIARNIIETEFEYFYQNILNDISNIPQHDVNNIKTRLRSTCEK